MTVSRSALAITWTPPDIDAERWEFFSHPAKQEYYTRNAIGWDDILSASAEGAFAPYPRSDTLGGITVSLSYHTWEDYTRYLAKARRGYRLSYARMEDDLHRTGSLTLQAPVVLAAGDDGLLFSGYRRLCLAWNHGMTPFVWLITL